MGTGLVEIINDPDKNGIAKIEDAIIKDIRPKLSLIPSDVNLAACEIQLSDVEDRNFILKKQLEKVRENYEFVIIDTARRL